MTNKTQAGEPERIARFDYEHTMQETLIPWPDGQFVRYSDHSTSLAASPLSAALQDRRIAALSDLAAIDRDLIGGDDE